MKQITCISCPVGCRINVDVLNGEHIFSGNKCVDGTLFAETELAAPLHTMTIMVRTAFPDIPFLSVRTNREVPKEKVNKAIRLLSKITVKERKRIGETIIRNILGTNCDIIAASDMY
jgi:CxxC motif-containing protein